MLLGWLRWLWFQSRFSILTQIMFVLEACLYSLWCHQILKQLWKCVQNNYPLTQWVQQHKLKYFSLWKSAQCVTGYSDFIKPSKTMVTWDHVITAVGSMPQGVVIANPSSLYLAPNYLVLNWAENYSFIFYYQWSGTTPTIWVIAGRLGAPQTFSYFPLICRGSVCLIWGSQNAWKSPCARGEKHITFDIRAMNWWWKD